MKEEKEEILQKEELTQEEQLTDELQTEETKQPSPVDWEQLCQELTFQLELEKENVLRVLADSENLKKRLIREKEQYCRFATSALIEELLPVLDTLEMAVAHGSTNEACKSLVQGVDMTLKMFFDVLKRQETEPVGKKGDIFDPALHEAMGQVENDEMEEGCIGELLQRGYRQKDRLLRPAKVLVSKKGSAS